MFPKRGAIALALTAIGLAFLLSFKTPAQTPLTATGARSLGSGGGLGGGTTSGTTDGQAGVTDQGGTLPGGSGSGTGGTDGSGGAFGSGSGGAAPSPSASNGTGSGGSGSTGSGSKASGSFTGSVVSTRYGDVQVQVTLQGGRIVDVAALQLPNNDFRSYRISQAAEPLLRNEALQAQSANIDVLSGATYTSMGYAQSLQAALDRAGV